MHSCGDLMVAAHSFAEKHFSEVVQADEFLALPNIQVEELISSDQLTVPSEEKVQDCIVYIILKISNVLTLNVIVHIQKISILPQLCMYPQIPLKSLKTVIPFPPWK